MADRYHAMTDEYHVQAWDIAVSRYVRAVVRHGSGTQEARDAWSKASTALELLVAEHARRVNEAARAMESQVAG